MTYCIGKIPDSVRTNVVAAEIKRLQLGVGIAPQRIRNQLHGGIINVVPKTQQLECSRPSKSASHDGDVVVLFEIETNFLLRQDAFLDPLQIRCHFADYRDESNATEAVLCYQFSPPAPGETRQ